MKRTSLKERTAVEKIISGKMNINSKTAQKILQKPHIALTFEMLREKEGLTDEALITRMKDILYRKPNKSKNQNTGTVATNQAQVDANAKAVAEMFWKMQGKFVEKHEMKHSGRIGKLEDEQLDDFIEHGRDFLKKRGLFDPN